MIQKNYDNAEQYATTALNAKHPVSFFFLNDLLNMNYFPRVIYSFINFFYKKYHEEAREILDDIRMSRDNSYA